MQRLTGSWDSPEAAHVIIYDARPDVAAGAAPRHTNSHT